MQIAAPLLSHLIGFAAFRGIPAASLYGLLSREDYRWDDPEDYLPAEEHLAVLQKIATELEDEYLGLSYGYFLNLRALGLIHTLSLSTTSLQQALLFLDQFLQSKFPLIQIESQPQGDHLYFGLECSVEDEVLRRYLLDSTFAFIFRELCLMISPEHIHPGLPHADLQAYQDKLRKDISHATDHSFRVDLTALDGEINPRSLRSIEVLLPQFMQMLGAPSPDLPAFTRQTRQMILHMCSPELPGLGQVCSQFAMTERSFQRKLSAEGHSFRSISNQIKHELATYLREGNKMKTQDIAYILGYSEASAYLHAFRNWQRVYEAS